MNRILLVLFTSLVSTLNIYAQDNSRKDASQTTESDKVVEKSVPISLKVNGFVMENIYYDSRKSFSVLEDLLYFYPLPENLDSEGEDINKQGAFNFVGIFSRLQFSATGPDVFGAKTKAYMEMDYTGYGATNGVRLRHVFIKFDWEKASLLVGQYWHPLFIASYPGTISINTGIPYQSFSRSPQINFNYKIAKTFNVTATALYQAAYQSSGPDGKSYSYQRNASLPDVTLRAEVGSKDKFVFGAAGNYKWIKPKQSTSVEITDSLNVKTEKTYVADQLLGSFTAMGYIGARFGKLSVDAKACLAQNSSDQLKPSGYAVATYDSLTGKETYTNLNYFSTWLNVVYGKKFKVGLFGGLGVNLGASDNLFVTYSVADDTYMGTTYGLHPNLAYSYRISPYVMYTAGPVQLGAEVEYTTAAWGTVNYNNKANVENTEEVTNIRYSLRMLYTF